MVLTSPKETGETSTDRESNRSPEPKPVFEFTLAVPPSGELVVESVERMTPIPIPFRGSPFVMAKGLGGQKAVTIAGYAWIRYQRFARIEVRPLALDENSQWILYGKIRARFNIQGSRSAATASVPEDTHFEPVYRKLFPNYEQAKAWRSMPPSPRTAAWYNKGNTYVKFPVAVDGLYKITTASLSAAGVLPSTVDLSTIQLLAEGQPVPFEAYGLDDGTFDENDAIVFYGKKHDGNYTDTLMYWLTWGTGSGVRIPSTQPADTVKQIPVIQRRLHLEENGTIEYYQGGGGPDQQNESGYNPGE
ncbi:MAG: hypothetical protein GXO82_06725, partial [Chlorobi bacterium]|nr:hypothetical protein [Chlorobiota bacterium]